MDLLHYSEHWPPVELVRERIPLELHDVWRGEARNCSVRQQAHFLQTPLVLILHP